MLSLRLLRGIKKGLFLGHRTAEMNPRRLADSLRHPRDSTATDEIGSGV